MEREVAKWHAQKTMAGNSPRETPAEGLKGVQIGCPALCRLSNPVCVGSGLSPLGCCLPWSARCHAARAAEAIRVECNFWGVGGGIIPDQSRM